jgi:dihydrofolate reductase
MRKLIEGTLITLNGVVTNQGKWSTGYFDAEAKAESIEALNECDLLLLGRVTYEQFAPRWSQIRDDPYFAAVNAMRKVVLSNTLATATWNAEVLRGDAAEQVRALKQQPGKAILKYGVTALDRALIANQLIDEFRFWIYPVVAEGTQLFNGIDTSHMQLELISTQRYASGVVRVNYRPRWLSSERPKLNLASRVKTNRT